MAFKQKATDEQLIKAYGETGSVWKAAGLVGMSGQQVHARLQRMGKIKEPKWTPEEDRLLKQLYDQFPETCFLESIAQQLKRSRAGVACRANELGLTRQSRPQSKEHARRCIQGVGRYTSTKNGLGASTHGGKREDLGIYVRSAWEANYARYLNWLKSLGEIKDWDFEPETFEFPVRRGTRFYTPDFRVEMPDGSIEYHEVKGYLTQQGRTALDRMKRYYPEVTIFLVDGPVYKRIAKKVSGIIPNWETYK